MTTPFSWSDTAHLAFNSCLPCLRPVPSTDSLHNRDSTLRDDEPYNPAINRIPRARPDELQGLLADSDTDPAETLSLHSNPGRGGRKRKGKSGKRKANSKPRRITLFGYDLFGRPAQPPIHLPDDEEEDALLFRRHQRSSTPTTTLTAHSAQTFDSDAAPLDVSTISELSGTGAAAAAEAEAQRLKEKEERRQRRRAKKEMKRLAEAGVVGDGEEFEGFQGSGALGPAVLPRHPRLSGGTTSSGSGSHSRSNSRSNQSREDFGQFVAAPPPEDFDDATADLDGGLYARKRNAGSNSNGGSGSDSRSRSSASDPRSRSSASDPNHSLPGEHKKKPKKTSSRSRSNTSSQSPSLPSPVSPAFSEHHIVSPSTVEQGQGFFDLEGDHQSGEGIPVGREQGREKGIPVGREQGIPVGREHGLPVARIGGGGGFPMTGFAGGGGKRSRDFGVFLARRGDEEGKVGGL